MSYNATISSEDPAKFNQHEKNKLDTDFGETVSADRITEEHIDTKEKNTPYRWVILVIYVTYRFIMQGFGNFTRPVSDAMDYAFGATNQMLNLYFIPSDIIGIVFLF